jgi:cytochrome c553
MAAAIPARFLALALIATTSARSPAAPARIEYNRDIRPILSENCFACHGADSASRKGKLRLDSFADATAKREDGSPALVPGKPKESEAIRRIFVTDDDLMPPEKSHKILTATQKDLLKRWVAQGAEYQPHWAFIAPVRPALPKVKNAKWARNPVDQFILARLEQEKLKPAPEADRRTLARRVSLDLTGLPPTPKAVEQFVADTAPDAYEKLVDRLLASPQWGEHRARYWLDAARYADTHGIHFDNYREMWTYRDWVINAFNQNMRFDEFTIENLAGDLLPQATLEQKIASGFNRCNITTSEGGAIDEEYLVLYARDRTDTTAQVWLGLTAGCAVCHDHKYDPLSQKEFYQLSAFFNNTTQKAMDGNAKDTPPIIVVAKPEEQARWDELQPLVQTAQKRVADRRQEARVDFDGWRTNGVFTALEQQTLAVAPVLHVALAEGGGESVAAQLGSETRSLSIGTNASWTDGVIAAKAWTVTTNTALELADCGDFERTNKFSYAAWVKIGADKMGSVIARMKDGDGFAGWDLWIQDNKPAAHIVHQWPDNTLKVIGKKDLPKDKWVHLCVTYDGSSKARGLKIYLNGELLDTTKDKDSLKDSIHTEVPLTIGQRTGGARVEGAGIQDVRVFAQELTKAEVAALAEVPRLQYLAAKPADTRSKEETDEAFPLWLKRLDAPFQELTATHDKLKEEAEGIRLRGTVAHVMHERDSEAEAYLLFRGEYDKRRDKLNPATPAVFPAMPADLPRNRLGFAQWLVRPENPLAARVTVNRFWQELFGAGIVRTAGDFGIAGEMPSHPELLDWLAVEFRESGWNVKQFYRLLVTSATYRQSAANTSAKLAKDPQNRLLAHGPRFRMDAEMIRDYALATSGLLTPKIGGPSVKPYQPDGIWEAVAMPESNTRKYERDSGEKLYRRSLYTFWKRAAPPASMDVFNAPSRETCTVRRERTSTPLQALVTLNDPQFVEAARNLAERTLKDGGAQDEQRLDFMAERLIARPLQTKERKIVAAGLKDLLAHYRAEPKQAEALLKVGESKADTSLDQPTLAAYTMVANQLMNLDEVLNK